VLFFEAKFRFNFMRIFKEAAFVYVFDSAVVDFKAKYAFKNASEAIMMDMNKRTIKRPPILAKGVWSPFRYTRVFIAPNTRL
jgi:hypothetical protein